MTIGLTWIQFSTKLETNYCVSTTKHKYCERNHLGVFPANMTHRPNAGLILNHRMRRWSRIKPRLGRGLVFCGCIVLSISVLVIVMTSSPWVGKGISATLQSGRYTPSYPRGRLILMYHYFYTFFSSVAFNDLGYFIVTDEYMTLLL